jgi:hypothetical protein
LDRIVHYFTDLTHGDLAQEVSYVSQERVPGGQVIKGDKEFRGEGDQIIRICKDKDLKRLA